MIEAIKLWWNRLTYKPSLDEIAAEADRIRDLMIDKVITEDKGLLRLRFLNTGRLPESVKLHQIGTASEAASLAFAAREISLSEAVARVTTLRRMSDYDRAKRIGLI